MVRATTIFRYRFKTIKADATLMPIACQWMLLMSMNWLVLIREYVCYYRSEFPSRKPKHKW